MNSVTVRGLNLRYGKEHILRDLSLTIEPGEFFVVIGPNGSGKTTLLKVLAHLAKPASGSVEILGKSLFSYGRGELARRLALVPQQMPLDFPFTVAETVLMGRSPHLGLLGVEGKKDYAIAREAMEFTDVVHLENRRLDQLSGGERQRVVIARAICQQPEIILLDEPTAALDPAHQVHIMDLMERFRMEKSITVVMVSHDLNLAALYGDRLLLLKDGQTLTVGSPQEVLSAERLRSCYGCEMRVDGSGFGHIPRITPVPGKYRNV